MCAAPGAPALCCTPLAPSWVDNCRDTLQDGSIIVLTRPAALDSSNNSFDPMEVILLLLYIMDWLTFNIERSQVWMACIVLDCSVPVLIVLVDRLLVKLTIRFGRESASHSSGIRLSFPCASGAWLLS